MRRSPVSALALLAMLVASAAFVGLPARADNSWCRTVTTENRTQSRVWVTIYDVFKTRQLDYGWVDACSSRDWKSGNYACGSIYYVRGEVKNFDLSQNVYDTTVQLTPNSGSPSDAIVAIRRGTGNYYWNHGSDKGPCDAMAAPGTPPPPPPPPAPQVDFGFVNATPEWASVGVFAVDRQKVVINDCLGPGVERHWKVAPDSRYAVSAHSKLGASCHLAGQELPVITYTARPDNGAVKAGLRVPVQYQIYDAHGSSP